MDKQPYIDRMLEIENLTDALEDADASWLLDWGASQMDTVLQGANDASTAGQRANALMAVMRKINRITGSYTDKSPQSLAADLGELYGLFEQAFGQARPAGEASSAGQPETRAATAVNQPPAAAEPPAAAGQAPAGVDQSSAEAGQPPAAPAPPPAEPEKPAPKERRPTGEMRAEEMEDRAEGKYPSRRVQPAPPAAQNAPGEEKAAQTEQTAPTEQPSERAAGPVSTPPGAQPAAPTPAALEAAARRLADLDTRQVLAFLTHWYFTGAAQ